MAHANPAALIFIVFILGTLLTSIFLTRIKGKKIYVRRIPGVDACEDAVSIAAEKGRPVIFSTGLSSLGPLLYATLGIMRFVAHKSAKLGNKFLVPCNDPEVLIVAEATVQNAYKEAKKSSSFDPSAVSFLSNDQFAYASGFMGLTHRENAGATFLMGQFAAESLILAEAGQQVGAFQVGGTTSYEQLPFLITACDYTLIGEELFAAGAYLSEEPVLTASLRAQDIIKLSLLAFILVGVVAASFNYNFQKYLFMSW